MTTPHQTVPTPTDVQKHTFKAASLPSYQEVIPAHQVGWWMDAFNRELSAALEANARLKQGGYLMTYENTEKCIAALESAGMGKHGSKHGNTLTGMVLEVCETLLSTTSSRDEALAKLDLLGKAVENDGRMLHTLLDAAGAPFDLAGGHPLNAYQRVIMLKDKLARLDAQAAEMREAWKELSAEMFAHVPIADIENPPVMAAIANMQVATKPTAHNSVLEELKNLKHEVAAESARAEGYEEELVSLRARVAELEGKSLVDEITKTPYEL